MVLARAFSMPGRGSGRARRSRPGQRSRWPVPGWASSPHGGRSSSTPRGTTFPSPRAGPRSAWSWSSSTAPPWTCSTARNWRRSPASPREGSTRSCGLPRCCRPGPCSGRPRPSAATATARTPWPISSKAPSAPGSSVSPTAASSPWTAGRFSATGAQLLWRVKNAARSVPFRQLRTLKDGPGLVLLRKSGNMPGRRRREAGDKTLPPLPDTVARLACFTVLTRTRRGRTKTTAIRILTTLPGPDAFPAREIAALYAARWQVSCFRVMRRGCRRSRSSRRTCRKQTQVRELKAVVDVLFDL